jgi:predicted alpha/beta hydrolase
VLVVLPAMGAAASYYEPFARRAAELVRGTTALADLRGQGRSSLRARRGDRFGYREIVELDLPALLAELARTYPGRPLQLVGHSLGGQLAALAAARQPSRVSGLVLLAAGSAHVEAWRRNSYLRARAMLAGVRLVARLLPWYPGHRLGFGGEQPRRLMRDWGRVTRTGAYVPEGSDFDYERALGALRLPVATLEIEADPIAPPAAVSALVAKMPLATVERHRASGVVSDPPWRRHFTWARRPESLDPGLAAALGSAGVEAAAGG